VALDALNAVAGKLILDKAGASPARKAQGVILAAAVPGLLGLAVPLIFAQQVKKDQKGSPAALPPTTSQQNEVIVPDLTGSVSEATRVLNELGLQVVVHSAYSSKPVDPQTVVSQRPPPNHVAKLGSTVVVFVSIGSPPKPDVPVDIDADLSAKIADLKADLDTRMDGLTKQLGLSTHTKKQG
jgi:PASTA domain